MRPRYLTNAEINRARLLANLGLIPAQIAVRLRRSKAAISKLARSGYPLKERTYRPLPADFAEQAVKLTVNGLKRHYGASYDTVTHWIAVSKADRSAVTTRKARQHKRRPCPPDFAERYLELGWAGVRRHYGITSSRILKRWRREAGLVADPIPAPKPAHVAMTPPPGYEDFKHKLPRPREIYGVAA